MSLETAVYINTLDQNQPAGDDPVAQADDHLRMIKAAIKATFPNVTGPVTASQATLSGYTVPAGGIIMWSGSVASIPAGWLLCNGAGGTPNLLDRFIVGAGAGYGVGAQGGAVTASTAPAGGHAHSTDVQGSHSHGGATANHWLTVAEMPSHTHTTLGGVQAIVMTPDGYGGGSLTGGYRTTGPLDPAGGGGPHNHPINTDGAHGHNISFVGDHQHTVDTRSPFYALCFIMKT